MKTDDNITSNCLGLFSITTFLNNVYKYAKLSFSQIDKFPQMKNCLLKYKVTNLLKFIDVYMFKQFICYIRFFKHCLQIHQNLSIGQKDKF